MEKVELRCGVYGEGIVFSVEIGRNASVELLQKAIVNEKKDANDLFKVDPATLKLYLARKNDAWLKDDDTLDEFLGGQVDEQCKKMRTSWKLDKEELFGQTFELGEERIHVLVELPHPSAMTLEGLMPAVDEGWTDKWLNDFRKCQIASHNLPRVGELAEFIENELPVKITLHKRIREK